MGETIQTIGPLAGICGHDGTNWEKVLIDATKRLVVAVAAFSDVLEVIQDTPGDLLMGAHGFDGVTWRKNNLLWGYHDRAVEVVSATTVAGGNTLNTTAVPAGEVHVIQAVSVHHTDAVNRICRCRLITSGADYVYLISESLAPFSTMGTKAGLFTLAPGDYVTAYFAGMAAGVTVLMAIWGYKMDVQM